MELEKRKSGLVIPKPKPEPPKRRYGLMEIQGEGQRLLAAEGLMKLWDAMGLSCGCAIRSRDDPSVELREEYRRLWRLVGEMLLGEDCPEEYECT